MKKLFGNSYFLRVLLYAVGLLFSYAMGNDLTSFGFWFTFVIICLCDFVFLYRFGK